MTTLKSAPLVLALAASLGGSVLAACAPSDATSDESPLTSLTGEARTLTFEGYVYAADGARDAEILAAVRKQTQSAFGALRTAEIGVADRELKEVDAATFRKESLAITDAATGKPTGTRMTRVGYRYSTTAIVPKKSAGRSALTLALLTPGYGAQTKRILTECTENTEHDREFESSIWYVFDPSLSSCKSAMAKEQAAIDGARGRAPAGSVTTLETNRLYVPVTMQFTPSGEGNRKTYPEYDRLFAGGVKKDRLVIGFVAGLAADWAAGEKVAPLEDNRWPIWLKTLEQVFHDRPAFNLVRSEPQEDFTKVTTASGDVAVPGGFSDLLDWESGRARPAAGVREAFAQKVIQHWLTFEVPVSVSIGGGASKAFTIELQTYFGSSDLAAPYRRAVKTSDVFLYAGHSYIGYGPLDPSNFSSDDFSSAYQLFFVNGCVSFNYYDRDYFTIKEGGSKNLDTITNGLETLQNGSGEGMGRFLSLLISGKNASYEELLGAAQFDYAVGSYGRDGLRVVDGEQDNAFDPAKSSVSVK